MKTVLECAKCKIEIVSAAEMKNHVKKPHRKCDQCPFQTTKLTSLKPHVEKEHGGSFNCEACDFSGSDMKVVKKHTEDDHTCTKCTKPKGKKLALDCKTCKLPTHVDCLKLDIGKERIEKYRSNKIEFQCVTCIEKLMGIDMIIPTNEDEPNSCDVCEYKSKTVNDLKQHKQTHVGNNLNCELCSVRSMTISQLSEHMKTHTGSSSFICDICNEKVKTANALDVHMNTHSGPSGITCPICGVKQKTNEDIMVHMNVHDAPSNVEKGLEESCKKLEELVAVEQRSNGINKSTIISLEKEIKEMKKAVEKADKRTLEVNENVKTLSDELKQSKDLVNSEIRKNEQKQIRINELEQSLKDKNENRGNDQTDQELVDVKNALERAKDVIIEYKAEVNRVVKDKNAEVGKVMIEKIRLQEDLRTATMEKKRLADSERILLNTFDTLKKYYDTKDKEDDGSARTPEDNRGEQNNEIFKCNKCGKETNSKETLSRHISDDHDIDVRQNINDNVNGAGGNEPQTDTQRVPRGDAQREQQGGQHREQHGEPQHQARGNGHYYGGRNENNFCVHWNRGRCMYTDEDCLYAHKESPHCFYQDRCDKKNICRFLHADNFLGQSRNTWGQV